MHSSKNLSFFLLSAFVLHAKIHAGFLPKSFEVMLLLIPPACSQMNPLDILMAFSPGFVSWETSPLRMSSRTPPGSFTRIDHSIPPKHCSKNSYKISPEISLRILSGFNRNSTGILSEIYPYFTWSVYESSSRNFSAEFSHFPKNYNKPKFS